MRGSTVNCMKVVYGVCGLDDVTFVGDVYP